MSDDIDKLEVDAFDKGTPINEDDLREKFAANSQPALTYIMPDRKTVGAFVDHDQQAVALFLGGGNVLIVHDDGTTQGNAIELTDIQRSVLGARLRKISNLIVTRQLS